MGGESAISILKLMFHKASTPQKHTGLEVERHRSSISEQACLVIIRSAVEAYWKPKNRAVNILIFFFLGDV